VRVERSRLCRRRRKSLQTVIRLLLKHKHIIYSINLENVYVHREKNKNKNFLVKTKPKNIEDDNN